LFTLAWTTALVVPRPDDFVPDPLSPSPDIPFSEMVHVGGYAFFAALTAWARPPRRLRGWLLLGLVLHALGSEVAQGFVPPRTASWVDAAFDLVGIVLGVILTWKWWAAAGPEHRGRVREAPATP
jgi:VanZ family protein